MLRDDHEESVNAVRATVKHSAKAAQRSTSPHTLLILLLFALSGIFFALLLIFTEQRPATKPPPASPPTSPRTTVDYPAPHFELPLLDGVTLVSPAQYKGRPLFLNFWATWCAPCVRELPALAAFADTYADNDKGPALLTINLGETAAEITSFLDALNLPSLPVAMDINQTVKRDYGVQNLPTTFVIDADGMVRHLKLGEMTYDEMEVYLQQLNSQP